MPLARPEFPQTASAAHTDSVLNHQLSKTACLIHSAIAAATASIAPSDSRSQAIALAAAKLVLLATLTVSDAWPIVPVPALLAATHNI